MKRRDINERLDVLGKLLTRPEESWLKLKKNDQKPIEFQREFMLPAFLIFVIAEMLGMLIDADAQIGPNWFIIVYSVAIGIGLFLSYRLAVWLMCFLLKSFDYKEEPIVIYRLLGLPLIIGYIPIEVTALFQSMFFLILLSIYAFYIFWKGIQTLIKLEKEKQQIYGVLSIVFSVGAHALVFFILLAIRRPIIDLF